MTRHVRSAIASSTQTGGLPSDGNTRGTSHGAAQEDSEAEATRVRVARTDAGCAASHREDGRVEAQGADSQYGGGERRHQVTRSVRGDGNTMAEGFIDISFSVAGVEPVTRRLVTWGKRIEDLSPAWEEVGQDLLLDFSANYEVEGGVFSKGSKWPPLALSTVADRIRKGYGGWSPMLVRTGALKASVLMRGAPGNVYSVNKTSLTMGSTYPTAVFHQFGTRKMPARTLVGLSWNRRSGIVARLNDYIQQTIAQSGLSG